MLQVLPLRNPEEGRTSYVRSPKALNLFVFVACVLVLNISAARSIDLVFQFVDDNENEATTSWRKNIDLFIPWSGLLKHSAKQQSGTGFPERDRDNGELVYLLRSVAKHAPWVHNIWVAINTPPDGMPFPQVEIPASLENRVMVIDRCSYMPKGTCPTRNSHAVEAFAHRLERLSEYFIVVEDDIFLGRPVTPQHFYNDSQPYVWRQKPSWGFFQGQEFHRLYQDPSVASFPTPRSSSPTPHFWLPHLKSICALMELQYSAFYTFLGSHTDGRYSSLAKGASDKENSQEEDPYGWMTWKYLITNTGVYKNIDSQRFKWWDEVVISEKGFQKALRDQAIFMNVNDRFSKNVVTYQRQREWFQSAMNKLFPAENRTVFTDGTQMENEWVQRAKNKVFKPKEQVMVFVHPRTCGGTTLLHLFQHYSPQMYISIDQWKHDPSRANQTNIVFEVMQEFDTFQLKQECDHCYISLGREPIDRVVSLYYWRKKKKQIPQMTLEEYLSKQNPKGVHRDDHYHGFYSWMQQWCGKNHRCTRFATEGEWVLAAAKKNVQQHAGLIGTLDHFERFVKAGTIVFPSYFGKGDYCVANLQNVTHNHSKDLEVARKHYPSTLLDLETRFYNWMKGQSENMISKLGTIPSTLSQCTWRQEENLFWEDNGEEVPWRHVGYRPASFDSADAPEKSPQLE